MNKILILLLAVSLYFSPSLEGSEQEGSPVKAELFYDTEAVKPGEPLWVGIRLTLDDGWHAYWKNPGDAGFPISVSWELPSGYQAGPLLWPAPQRFDSQSVVGYGYEGEVFLLTQISVPKGVATPDIGASLKWLACSDTACLPGGTQLNALKGHFASAINAAVARLPKEMTLGVTRNGDLLEVAVEEKGTAIKNAYFCPEEQHLIDDHIPATLISDEKGQRIVLKDSGSSTDLKGILVIERDEVESIALATPIQSKGSDGSFLTYNDIKKGVGAPALTEPATENFAFEGGLLFYLMTALVGGLILNLMPCVMPVISFKILSFVKMAGQSRSATFKHGAAFSLGVLVSFWTLASGLLLLQAYGHSVGWGFQLQEPIFVASLAAVMLVFGLSLFGLFEMGTLFASWAGQNSGKVTKEKKESLYGSFFSGVLATAVATPCTGPFLGPAVGFAVTQPPFAALLIFTFLGLGMALPYLILSAFPSLLRFVPRPGPWMVTFKEATGFIMIATVMWLLWVFGAQTDSFALFLLMAGLFLLAIGSWIFGKWGSPVRRRPIRIVGLIFTTACFLLGANIIYTASSPAIDSLGETRPLSIGDHHPTGAWEPFSRERLKELQAKGIPVFIDFTARWCLICQANHLVLSVDEVDKKMTEMGVVKMKADWTKYDPIITEELKKYGRSGVPLYLLYDGKNDEAEVMSQVLTPSSIIQSLEKIENQLLIENAH